MARFAIIQNSTVANIVQAAPAFAASQGWVAAANDVGIGWTYNGSVFTAPAAQPVPVPFSVTRYQFFTAIRNAGRANDLRTYIQGLANGELEAWQNRNRVYRASAMIEAARVALGVTNNAVDNLFRAAADVED